MFFFRLTKFKKHHLRFLHHLKNTGTYLQYLHLQHPEKKNKKPLSQHYSILVKLKSELLEKKYFN